MPPKREVITGLDPHYYAILSAFTKSMRVSNPLDSLYYLFLLQRTTTGVPGHVLMRTLSSGAEDGFAVRVMTHQLQWQYRAKTDKTFKGEAVRQQLELSVYSIAAQASAYNSGEKGLGWNWTDNWQETWLNKSRRMELGECDEPTLRKHVWDLSNMRQERAGYLYILRFWRMHQNYGRAWESLHKLAVEWALHRADVLGDNTLKNFALAYQPMCRWLAQEHGGMAENWFRRLLYFAARGTTGVRGHTPELHNEDFLDTLDEAHKLYDRRARKGILKLPCYAYDGRHCYADKGVKDARFCGDAKGNVNMYAMAARDGKLDVHAQGVTQTVPEQWLAKPYLTFKVAFPTLLAV